MANETLKLSLQPREITGKKVKDLRKEGILPIAICGRGVEPYSAQIEEREFMRVINRAGYTGLIELSMPGRKKQSAFLLEVQRNSVTGRVVHADLRVVDVNKPVEVDVPVVAHGENTLVEKGQAILNQTLSSITVRALPTAIPHEFGVDISTLVEFDQHIYVRDLVASAADVELLIDPDTMVFVLSHAKVEPAEEPTTEEAGEEAAGEAASSDEE
ncbi:MAG TPA: 50S ribosomal protein L25 [Herpetosiphonaceae bacterium]|nr:50S ribosomal protein L25 [Herpetosiphonaceae bacterium]